MKGHFDMLKPRIDPPGIPGESLFGRTPRVSIVLSCLLLFLAPLRGQEEPVLIDEIVAKVNEETITWRDVQGELAILQAGLQGRIEDPEERVKRFEAAKRGALRGMIESRLMIQKAEEMGIGANADVEISSYMDYLRKESGIPNMEVFDQVLRRQGSSLNDLRRVSRQRYISDTLIHQLVYSRLTVMTQEVEEYYESNIKRFTVPAVVDLAEILFLTEGKDKAAVRSKAEKILSQLKAGTPFEELAKESSEGPSASKGGAIGLFNRGTMAEKLEAVSFSLKAGEFSEIIEAEYGYQIIKVLSMEPARKKPLEKVRGEVQNAVHQKKGRPQVQKFLEELRRESYIYVAPEYRKRFDVEGLGSVKAPESQG